MCPIKYTYISNQSLCQSSILIAQSLLFSFLATRKIKGKFSKRTMRLNAERTIDKIGRVEKQIEMQLNWNRQHTIRLC